MISVLVVVVIVALVVITGAGSSGRDRSRCDLILGVVNDTVATADGNYMNHNSGGKHAERNLSPNTLSSTLFITFPSVDSVERAGRQCMTHTPETEQQALSISHDPVSPVYQKIMHLLR